jgi:hypothetical protein
LADFAPAGLADFAPAGLGDFAVGVAGVGPASGGAVSSTTTIGSAPMSGVERRLARSPDARAAPAASAP